ncbi:MAG: TA system VapC family ribonuclease toxin [Candidatus Auribacterota bacterium]|nr:TA system VapC family ribonuclease toxin [Candidatus Auribacterota bacterium]
MFVVDTNILLYAANTNSGEHKICRRFILECRKQVSPWYLTWGIVYEFLRVATHPRVFRKPLHIMDAWKFIQSLQASPSLSMLMETDLHSEVASEVFNAIPLLLGNLVFDGRTAVLMKEHGIKRIYTRDTDFHRFPFLEVIDPLQV